jgi:hypothetical protein
MCKKVIALYILLTILVTDTIPLFSEMNKPEVSVKAAYLYHFSLFTKWPETVLKDENQAIIFCVLGEDPIYTALKTLIEGKTVKNYSIIVTQVKNPDDLKACHLLYITNINNEILSDVLKKVQNWSVLTVSDLDEFCSSGGVIQLYRDKNNIKFAINPDAMQRMGLEIQAQVLTLAAIIRDKKD